VTFSWSKGLGLRVNLDPKPAYAKLPLEAK